MIKKFKILRFDFYPEVVYFQCRFLTSRSAITPVTNWPTGPQRVGSREKWRHLLTCLKFQRATQLGIKWSYDLRSYERNFCNCVEKPEKFRTSTGFEPVTSRFRCDALTNWAMKPLTLGAGHLWVLMVPRGMNQWWMVYEMNHIWIADMKPSEAMIFAVMNAIFAIA